MTWKRSALRCVYSERHPHRRRAPLQALIDAFSGKTQALLKVRAQYPDAAHLMDEHNANMGYQAD
jgi:hypothetical protein